MQKLGKILISIDQSYMDEQLMNFTFSSTKLLDIESTYLMYVSTEDIHAITNFEGQEMSLKERLKIQIQRRLEKVVSDKVNPNQVEIIVKQGEPFSQILHFSKKESVDLIVVGKKHIGVGTGNFSKKISRKAPCSVLTVTENSSAEVKKILVPIDFSTRSQYAIDEAYNFAQKAGNEIIAMHIYSLPVGYTTSGKSVQEYSEIMKKHASKRMDAFLAPFMETGIKIEKRLHLDKNGNNEARIIINTALVEDADLLMMGSRGKSSLAATFLGSNTENILKHNMSIPTLVHKHTSKKSTSLFEALLQV